MQTRQRLFGRVDGLCAASPREKAREESSERSDAEARAADRTSQVGEHERTWADPLDDDRCRSRHIPMRFSALLGGFEQLIFGLTVRYIRNWGVSKVVFSVRTE